MLSALRSLLSPARRRFMRECGRPALAGLRTRLEAAGSRRAIALCSTLLDANREFLAFALSAQGPLSALASHATPETVEACLAAMLIFSVNLFARDDLARNDSELIPLLAKVARLSTTQVMLRRDNLRKAPRSEEWMLYSWMVKDLQAPAPKFDSALEQAFGYQYLSY